MFPVIARLFGKKATMKATKKASKKASRKLATAVDILSLSQILKNGKSTKKKKESK